MEVDEISTPEKIEQLREELAIHFDDKDFLECESMGKMLRHRLYILLYNNKDILS